MKRSKNYLLWLFLLGAYCSFGQQANPSAPPNIILILADDLGYMDIQAYAQQLTGAQPEEMYYETPHLNRLVKEGIAFKQAYANPLCSPTRASLLTGKNPAQLGFMTATPFLKTYYNQQMEVPRNGYAHDVLDHHDDIKIEHAWLNASTNTALPAGAAPDQGRDEQTLAEALEGYHSAFIGKWHVGGHGAQGYAPADQGFEELAWLDAGGASYFNWQKHWNNPRPAYIPEGTRSGLVMGNGGKQERAGYLTDDLTDIALDFLDQRATKKKEPFFLMLSLFAVHSPFQAKSADVQYFENKPGRGWNGHEDATYAAMLRSLDESVGRILDKLKETSLEENTLLVFLSDNGGVDRRITPTGIVTNNYPLRGGKACVTEGGIRVPLVFWWPGRLEGGQWSETPVGVSDLFPTLLEVSGLGDSALSADLEGQSIYSLLEDPNNQKGLYARNTFYWHYPFNVIYNSPYDGLSLTPHSAIRQGDYKLIYDWHGRLYLYNIEQDPYEHSNLVSLAPDRTAAMFELLVNTLNENTAPQYFPRLNPDYDAARESREVPFINLMDLHEQGLLREFLESK
jgi:arylsulfatase A-like enzyme